jgi:integrase
MSYGTRTVFVHKKLKLDKRRGSDNWYVRMTLDNGKRVVKSTKTEDLSLATERAWELFHDTRARVRNNLPAQTRKFKHVAVHAIRRMQAELDEGGGKQAYKDYNSALRRWLIPYFADVDVAKIDFAALKAFDAWRTERNGKPFSQSGINNHNAALNRVLDEAELNGWIVKAMRPTLLNKGAKSESRGSFTDAEYKQIYTALRTWHKKTTNPKTAATREVLRTYVLFLANTGVRHGTEALGLRWRDITWHENAGERYLVVNVDGKTRKRAAVARDTVEGYLHRQSQLNPAVQTLTFDVLLSQRSAEHVFVTRLGPVASIFNLNRSFNALLDALDLKTGADGKSRTLYSLRHYYATRDLKRGVTTHVLSKQMGNSTAMIDRFYSKVSPLLNADIHSGRDMLKKSKAKPEAKQPSLADFAFDMLASGKLDDAELLAALGVNRDGYVVTEDIAMKALAAKQSELINGDTLLRILNG